MRLIQIFLPLFDNKGKRLPKSLFARERQRLVDRFGGMTSYVRSPAKGLWKTADGRKRDDLVIFEVMVRRVDRKWWTHYRHLLRRRFKQRELLVRSRREDFMSPVQQEKKRAPLRPTA